jgi:UDP-N-acetylglucosamine--N-acetylmuramyl-(pentapeptide) pyrophosphoryl-undecaprenol N-acetylglucosamine transferase
MSKTWGNAIWLTELSYAGKPMIVVPLPGSANDHQLVNAAELGRYGAVVMDGANVSVQVLLSQLDRIMEPATYADISARIRAFAKLDAADKIAQTILG